MSHGRYVTVHPLTHSVLSMRYWFFVGFVFVFMSSSTNTNNRQARRLARFLRFDEAAQAHPGAERPQRAHGGL